VQSTGQAWIKTMAAGTKKLNKHLATHGALKWFRAARLFGPVFMAKTENRTHHSFTSLLTLKECAGTNEALQREWMRYMTLVRSMRVLAKSAFSERQLNLSRSAPHLLSSGSKSAISSQLSFPMPGFGFTCRYRRQRLSARFQF
jgi:hypothetical protein